MICAQQGGDFTTAGFAHQVDGGAGGNGPFFRDNVLDSRQESQQGGGGLQPLGVEMLVQVQLLYISSSSNPFGIDGIFRRQVEGYKFTGADRLVFEV